MADRTQPDTSADLPGVTRGRLAPTPSGHLHVGNARSFLAAWLGARAAKGTVVLRIEDIDRERCRAELAREQVDDLRWLGLDWDEGPDVGGPVGPYSQSERLDRYRAGLEVLRRAGRVFPCVCSRKEVAAAASAPHEGEEQYYPGTCRGRFRDGEEARAASGREPAWRLLTEPGAAGFRDLIQGDWSTDTHALVGDYVVTRRDGWPAYQLAVVVDDGEMGVTQVVRGMDLIHSTARQIGLYGALGLTAPTEWAHLGLAVDREGKRLAKRAGGLSLAGLRGRGVAPERVIGVLAHSLGLIERPEPVAARELVGGFAWGKVPKGAWVVDGSVFGG